MPKYLIAEADLNFPVPNAARLTEELQALYDGRKPVTTLAMASLFGVSEAAIAAVLHRAELTGLVQQVAGQGWIPLHT